MSFPEKLKFINKAASLLSFPYQMLKTKNHFKEDLLHNFYKDSKLSSHVNMMITIYHIIHQGGPFSLPVRRVYLPVSSPRPKEYQKKIKYLIFLHIYS